MADGVRMSLRVYVEGGMGMAVTHGAGGGAAARAVATDGHPALLCQRN